MRTLIQKTVGTVLLLSMVFPFSSCREPVSEPVIDVKDPYTDTFVYNDVTFDIKSVVRNVKSSVVEFYLSPEQGLTTIDDVLSSENHVILKADVSSEGDTDYFKKKGSCICYWGLKFQTGDDGMAYIKFSYNSEGEVLLDFKAETLYGETGKSGGISGTYKGGFTDHVALEKLTLYSESETITTDGTLRVTAVCEPEGYPAADLEWTITSDTESKITFRPDGEDSYSYIISCEGEAMEGSVAVHVNDKYSDVSADSVLGMEVDEPGPGPEIEYNEIRVSPSSISKKVGDEPVRLVATCYYNGKLVESDDIVLQWSSDDENVAPVDRTGTVSFKSNGSAIITVANPSNTAVEAKCFVNVAKADVYVESILLNPTAKTMKPGDTFAISYVVSPENAVDKELSFTSDDTSVATVDGQGVVTAVAVGKTQIRVKASRAVAICSIEVTEDGNQGGERIPVESVQLKAAGGVTELPQYETLQIIPYYSPNGAMPATTKWISSDESIATVDENGVVTAVAKVAEGEEGKTVAITHLADNADAQIVLTVVRALPKSIRITDYPEGLKLRIGESFTFKAVVEPEEAPQDLMFWCSKGDVLLPPGVIGAFDGVFKATEAGVYSVGASSMVEQSVSASLQVEVLPIEIESASLNETSLAMSVGQSAILEVTFNPSNVTDKTIKWESSAPEVASVKVGDINASITAHSAGTAEITATLSNGMVLTCKVTVSDSASGPRVGDYFYSDGTFSTSLDASKDVVGVIFSINDATQQDPILKRDYPECTHGLVIGLDELAEQMWQENSSYVSTWAEHNGYTTLSGYQVAYGKAVINDNGRKLLGYNNTCAIIAYENSPDGKDVQVTDNLPSGKAADGASVWYVPSMGELLYVAENYEITNSRIEEAGGTTLSNKEYWSSTEGATTSNAASISLYKGTGSNKGNSGKYDKKYVRHIFAF